MSFYFLDVHNARECFSVPSHHHQTLLSKALFEHTMQWPLLAAVGAVSKSILHSSLAPNLLSKIRLDDESINLFSGVFHPNLFGASPVQFAPELKILFPLSKHQQRHVDPRRNDQSAVQQQERRNERQLAVLGKMEEFLLAGLVEGTRYFTKSLQSLAISQPHSDALAASSSPYWFLTGAFPVPLTPAMRAPTLSSLHTLIFNNYFPSTAEHVNQINDTLPSLRNLEVTVCEIGIIEMTLLSKLKKLTKLQVSDTRLIKEDCFAVLAESRPQFLVSLKFRNCDHVSDECLRILSNGPNNDDDNNNNNNKYVLPDTLTCLSLAWGRKLTDDGIKKVCETFSNLTELDLESCDSLTNSALSHIGRHLTSTNLKSLTLKWVSSITDAGLGLLVADYPPTNFSSYPLEYLDLHDCREITDEGVENTLIKFVNLKTLCLGFCCKISQRGLELICMNLKKMENLRLANMTANVPEKDVVRLFCENEHFIKNMKDLDLSYSTFSDETLLKFANYSNLRFLAVHNNPKLTKEAGNKLRKALPLLHLMD